MKYGVGIDIGYSTLKCVVLDNADEKIYDNYIFHHGDAIKALKEELVLIVDRFKIRDCYVGVTGSQGKAADNYSVNNISALIEGALYVNSETKSIMEIGAQNSRYITGFGKDSISNIRIFSNSSCSAGTGSFLEEQVSRLGIELDDYSKHTEKATKIPRIAGRCSVFSKTDMIHHQQDGARIEDILLGLSYALVRNYKANVVQRNEIASQVLFAGGVALNKGVCRSLIDVFKFKEDELIIPKKPAIISAIGAAIIAKKSMKIGRLENIAGEMVETENSKEQQGCTLEALASYGMNDAINKHVNVPAEGTIEGSIGIDIGSTSTNIVLLDDKSNVVSHRYLRTRGNPRKAVKAGMDSILKEYEGRLNIVSIGTTGSGRILIGKEMKANIVINEITAQAKGAFHFFPEVDTIFEIGGQDSKYIQIENGSVVNFEMNKICAAGTGSFIEEQAKKLEIEIDDYERFALKGRNPLNLGNRCTVFIEGNISKALMKGENKEDITAGLSYSIVNNYLNRVVVNKPIGKKILLQGGIAYNQSVVNAFRAVLKKDIIVPPYFSVLGAVGVGILAQEENGRKPSKVSVNAKSVDIQDKANQLFMAGCSKEIDSSKLTIGIPRVLFMHKLFPLFNAFFKELGFNVILSEATNEQVVEQSQMYSMDETCYPIKLINGHVANLITKGIDYLFLPSVHTMKHETSKSRENYACVYIQTAPKIVADLMDLEGKGIKLLSPALSLKFGKKYMMTTMLNIGKQLGKGKIKTALALKKGMQSFKRYEKEMLELGKTALNSGDDKVFVMITRAYGVADKGLNMKIPEKLKGMGYKVLTLSNLDAHKIDISEDYPNMYWPFGQHILAGAKIVKSTKNLYAIYLTYHGCGPDTILNHYFKEEMKGKPYMHIEVDEHDSNVGVMTRLEAFVDSIKHGRIATNPIEKKEITIEQEKVNGEDITTYIPYLFPYSYLIREMFDSKGLNAEVLEQ
ncbi:MAG: acyl-CoA dehydratase activase, partial [Clostridiales bacterium]|nr:acyl-CoA dehydratase activase [Clostridiales bacterium]